jgi:cellulose synthase/poly-beta-1,6-N-acetylglucosamine synthase-like glycosyltransferase
MEANRAHVHSHGNPPNVHDPSAESALPLKPRRDPAVFFSRLVVATVVGIVTFVTLLAVSLASNDKATTDSTTPDPVEIGHHVVLVNKTSVPPGIVIIALSGVVVIALCCVGLEVIAALLSVSPRRKRLARLRTSHGQRLPAPGERVRLTVVIPAHDEELSLPGTLEALSGQTRLADRVIVVADNCSDRTVQIARSMGSEAFETVGNEHKKGGALNQVLSVLLPEMGAHDAILVADADTQLSERFLEVAAGRLEADPELAAVGGVFYGEDGVGLLGQFQRNEYARYGLQIHQRHGRVFVLTGTATMFRADAMLDVAAARGVYIPGDPGKVYDTTALTEDNELTLALKSLGATMESPGECRVTTELMPTWRYLWKQRQRWQRGALENIGAYGLTRATLRYWGQQVGIGYGTVALNAFLLMMLITIVSVDQWIWFPFWLLVGSVFVVERVVTAWSAGWKGRLLAAALLPEICYDVFLQLVFLSCLFDISLNRQARWGHVMHEAAA